MFPQKRTRSRHHAAEAPHRIGPPVWSLFLFLAGGMAVAFQARPLGEFLFASLKAHLGDSRFALILGGSADAVAENMTALGFTLLTACTVGLYMDFVSRHSIQAFMTRELRNTIADLNTPTTYLALSGLAGFLPKRSHANFESLLDQSRHGFYAVGTTLPDILRFSFTELLYEKVRRNPSLQICLLLLNPLSAAGIAKREILPYQARPIELSRLFAGSIDEARRLRAKLAKIGLEANIEVRLYMTIPTISAVFNEKTMNLSFYDEQNAANRTPVWQFEHRNSLDGEFSLYLYYYDNFRLIWERPDSISLFAADAQPRLLALAAHHGVPFDLADHPWLNGSG